MSQAAEKQRCCNAPQINTYGPINIYFQPAPAPPPTEGPKSLFATNAERIKRTSVMKGKKGKQKPHSVLVWQSMADGTIKAGCHHCKKHFVDLAHFAPMDGTSRTQGARNKFDAAYAAYQAAHAAGDRDECIAQRGILESLRCAYCFECRKDKGYLSPAMKECKDYYDTMRKTMAKRHNGCQNPDCPERGGNRYVGSDNARRNKAIRVYPKQQYVDAAKRRIGKCAACARPVVRGKEVMHDFNHLDEATKSKGGRFGKWGGVAGLVRNPNNAATLDKVKSLLDDEMAKCNLLCRDCHHRHTWKYPPSATEFSGC